MKRTFRSRLSRAWFPSALALLWAVWPAAAQSEEPSATEPARFLIESIAVLGVDRAATRDIVAKESRVEPGTEVDEDQLRQAIYRVRRLPFVIDADFSLQKGSERGRYVLEIRIEMESSIFADLSGGWSDAHGVNFGPRFDWYASVGARRFVGARGYAFGSIDRGGNLQVGYTQFHLFGSGSYLSGGAATDVDDRAAGYSLSLAAGKPLSATQSLRGSLTYGSSDDSKGQSQNLEWRFDSTDDPLLPTRGGTATLQAAYGVGHGRFRSGEGVSYRSDSRFLSLGTGAQFYRPLTSRQSVWVSLGASRFDSESTVGPDRLRFDSSFHNASAGFGYNWDLLRSQVGEPRNDLRFGAGGNYARGESGVELLSFWAGLTYRRTQFSIDLSFSYTDDRSRQRFVQ